MCWLIRPTCRAVKAHGQRPEATSGHGRGLFISLHMISAVSALGHEDGTVQFFINNSCMSKLHLGSDYLSQPLTFKTILTGIFHCSLEIFIMSIHRYHQNSFQKVTLKGGCAADLPVPGGQGNATYYNCFEVHTITTFTQKPGEKKEKKTQRRLRNDSKMRLGLNKAWVQVPPPEKNSPIRELRYKFPYWGHVISQSIQDFNDANRLGEEKSNIRRKLVYDFRHGQADHNKWKDLLGEDEWAKVRYPLHPSDKKGSYSSRARNTNDSLRLNTPGILTPTSSTASSIHP